MDNNERDLLLEAALGKADAALDLCRMLFQLLMEQHVMPRDLMLSGLDLTALAAEEVGGDPRARVSTSIQIAELQSALEEMRALPPIPRKDDPA